MPAFVQNGPDIPERLLLAHEEDRVVFFCGAGISSTAGLPNFYGLVKRLYEKFDVSPDHVQKSAIKSGQYDKAIELLEADVAGSRNTVRQKMAEILAPDLSSLNATETHESLLTLSRNRVGQTRLVTTNFDRLFQIVVSTKQLNVEYYTAPLLPVPKNRWDGLVYLHGLLPENPTPEMLDRLVISSGDFGLAYLIERWAARFVSDLFQNFTVCFIGYGINDPVLRYMMDALAADRLLGENVLEMFAFGSFSKCKRDEVAREWEAKNVTPILYKKHANHFYLRKTLRAWADTYRDGVRGKKMIVAEHAATPPLSSSRSDFAVGRLLWALTDKKAAEYFAEMNPAPPLDWLGPLAEEQLGDEDLARFGLSPNRQSNDIQQFSFFYRPATYEFADRMKIVGSGYRDIDWDDVMYALAEWLSRHLDDPKLIIWLAKQGGELDTQFAEIIRSRINQLDSLVISGKQKELENIKMNAPMAIPRPLMRKLWQIILAGRLNSNRMRPDLHGWLDRYRREGLTPISRMELIELLTPRISIEEPFDWQSVVEGTEEPESINDLVNWKLVLASGNVHFHLREFRNELDQQEAVYELLQDFTNLLRNALDLKKVLGGADEWSDLSYVDQPSIADHTQNHTYQDWTALINLTRDAWLAMVGINPKQAKLIAELWWQIRYPLFKRLSFFAATTGNSIDPKVALDWLLSNQHWWFWSVETRREMFRLLVYLAEKLDSQGIDRIENAILQGPPRELYIDDIESGRLRRIVNRETWFRLAKLESAGLELGRTAKSKLDELSQGYPNWKLAPDERDEFTFWTGGEDDWLNFVTSPRKQDELMEWLMQPSDDFFQEDDWYQRCHEDFIGSFGALYGLASGGEWPVTRWRQALQVWRDSRDRDYSQINILTILAEAPDSVIVKLSTSLSSWLKVESNDITGNEKLFFRLCQRVLDTEFQSNSATDEEDSLTASFNDPVGQTTQAMLNWWYRQDLKDEQGLGEPIKSIFTRLCDTQIQGFQHGRIILAIHTISLLKVDSNWVIHTLLPLFNWQASETEARGVWMGILKLTRRYDLLFLTKQNFLETAFHYNRLGKYAYRYAEILTFEALDRGDVYSINELKQATKELPAEGLKSTAGILALALEGADDKRSEFWDNRIIPYLDSIWPKTKRTVTPDISSKFGELCITADQKFPFAVDKLLPWLKSIDQPRYLAYKLKVSGLCSKFPKDSLKFLDVIYGNNVQWGVGELMECLNEIKLADDTLVHDQRFVRLREL